MIFGYPRPLDLLEQLTSRDIALWEAYDGLCPYGHFTTNRLIAESIVVFYNMNKAKEYPPITVDEVLGIQQAMTEEYVLSTIRAFKAGR